MPTRSFLALDLPTEVKDAIQISPADHRTKPSPTSTAGHLPENLHLTINFLGELEDKAFESFKNPPHQSPSRSPSKPANILTLPEKHVPKILALNLAGDTERPPPTPPTHPRRHPITLVQQQTETRAFTPHITLGRLKKGIPPSAKPVKRLVGSFTPPKPLEWTLDELWLYTSTLTKEGPVYEKVHRYPADH